MRNVQLINECSGQASLHVRPEMLQIGRAARASQKGQAARCIWLTGLSGAGKSTLAKMLDSYLYGAGLHSYVLDGDNLRHGLNQDLGFSQQDRSENVRRVAQVARLMVDAGLVVIVGLISPLRQDRQRARSLFGPEEFIEVFVDAPLPVCEQRDVKGLYAKARRGELPQFTGIDSPYETPEAPECHLRCDLMTPDQALQHLVSRLII